MGEGGAQMCSQCFLPLTSRFLQAQNPQALASMKEVGQARQAFFQAPEMAPTICGANITGSPLLTTTDGGTEALFPTCFPPNLPATPGKGVSWVWSGWSWAFFSSGEESRSGWEGLKNWAHQKGRTVMTEDGENVMHCWSCYTGKPYKMFKCKWKFWWGSVVMIVGHCFAMPWCLVCQPQPQGIPFGCFLVFSKQASVEFHLLSYGWYLNEQMEFKVAPVTNCVPLPSVNKTSCIAAIGRYSPYAPNQRQMPTSIGTANTNVLLKKQWSSGGGEYSH